MKIRRMIGAAAVILLSLCLVFASGCGEFFNEQGIEITVPDIELPDITVPKVTIPDVTIPDITIPKVTIPDFGEKDESSGTSGNESSGNYSMADIGKLKNTENFAKGAIEHIFDGTINKKGKATGYHYAGVYDSKGSIISGTESEPDENGVYTAKVKVLNVKKNGFSSFYPDSWTPQQVVDAINTAYDYALAKKSRSGDLWIGYCKDIEIDMYLNNSKKITTAFPVYEGD